MNDWQSTESMRLLPGVTDERLAKGPRWARDYIETLERRLAEARQTADDLNTPIGPAPGVVEVKDHRNGTVVRFRPGARVRLYINDDAVDRPSHWDVQLNRFGSRPAELNVTSPDFTRLAALASGGNNTMALVGLED